jgi:single-strand DNA-binding protein
MNQVVLIGRLTKDPEIRYTANQMAVANFIMAVDRPSKQGEDEADFPRVTVFGRTAENLERYGFKGQRVAVSGRLQTGSYTNQNGDTIYTTDVIANRVEFLEWPDRTRSASKPETVTQTKAEPAAVQPQTKEHQETMEDFEAIDEDIPF